MDGLLLLFIIGGCYVVGDGAGSITLYLHQTLLEHIPRVLRSLFGASFVLGSFYISEDIHLGIVLVGSSMVGGAVVGWARARQIKTGT